MKLKDKFRESYILFKLNTSNRATIKNTLSIFEGEIFNNNTLKSMYKKYLTATVENASKLEAKITTQYNSVENFRTAFTNACKEVFGEQQGPSSGSIGSGGGGGGGGAATKNPNVVWEYEFDETIKDNSTKKENAFSDVPDEHWASESIALFYDMGIVNGFGDGRFLPDNTVKREEFVKMLVCALDLENDIAKCEFADVKEDNWSYTYISSAYESGIVNGNDKNNFGIGEYLSRQDLAVMVYRAALNKGIKADSVAEIFGDDDVISDYAKDSVYALKNLKIINGYENNTFEPNSNSTRAEVVTILHRLLTLLNENA